MKKPLVALFIILGILLVGIGIYYFSTPAGSLPPFFPGHSAGSSTIHYKHGIAAIVLAIGCGVAAWFASGKKRDASGSTE